MKILNSVMLLKSADDWGFVTVDLMCVNLFSGETCFYKYGAAPSYVMCGKTVRRIKGETVAAGYSAGEGAAPDVVRMNAVALSPDGLTVDPFDGIEDIRLGIVRCVGEPAVRFQEDALRMFRALRFAARLGFTIDIGTYSGIAACAPLAATLAAERVRDELEKTLLTNHTERIGEMIGLGLLNRYISPSGKNDALNFSALAHLQKKALLRWTAFSVLLQERGMGAG